MSRVTWDDLLSRAESLAEVPAAQFTAELLRSLRDVWEPQVDADFWWIHGVAFHRRGGPATDCVRVLMKRGSTGDVVEISLDVDRPRRGPEHPGGRLSVAGDICRPENAPVVVESFLVQLVESA